MPGATNKVDNPCEECRNRHLKCDNNRPKCSHCERAGQKCSRTKGQRKFRDGSSAQYEKQFSKDQVWLGFSKNAKIQIVDQTAELENFYSVDDPESEQIRPTSTPRPASSASTSISSSVPASTSRSQVAVDSPFRPSASETEAGVRSPTDLSPTSFENILSFAGTKRRRSNETVSPTSPASTLDRQLRVQLPPISQSLHPPFGQQDSPTSVFNPVPFGNSYSSPTEANETRRIEQEYAAIADNEAAKIPDEPFLSVSSWKKNFRWPNQYTTQQCRCLFRYYIEILGPWFDVGDPTRQFTAVVPQRAKRSPPLLNAIFSAAALHLRYSYKLKHPGWTIRYAGYDLKELNEVSTIKYYMATNAYLRVLCNNAAHTRDEDLLAATVIVRFYEELKELTDETCEEMLARPFQLFVAAQAKPDLFQLPYDQYDFRVPGAFANVRHIAEPYLKSYQHASFRIALRQECQRALLAREDVQLPLDAWKLLEGFDETEDSVWTDRHLYHYARVLQFCFSQHDLGLHRASRWEELQEFGRRWEQVRPLSFSPYHQAKADPTVGEVFPTIWYAHEVNAVGMLYYHLSRVLLAVYNPHIHRIGPGSAAAQRKVSDEVREIVVHLCGIAMSTAPSQPVLVQAYNTIAMFGEHFVDRKEQEALLGVLTELQSKHGWPVEKDADALKKEWNW